MSKSSITRLHGLMLWIPPKRKYGDKVKWSEVAQSCPTLCDPVNYSPPGSSVHGVLQARILEWVAISFSRGSSPPRDRTQVSHIAGRGFNLWATREAPSNNQDRERGHWFWETSLFAGVERKPENHQIAVWKNFLVIKWNKTLTDQWVPVMWLAEVRWEGSSSALKISKG